MRLKKPAIAFLFVSVMIALGVPASGNEGPVTIARSIPYAEGSEQEVVRAAVRNECQLQVKLSESIAANAAKRNLQVTRRNGDLDAVPGTVLTIKITKAIARAGGFYSGLKQVYVEGSLENSGKVLGSFEGKRSASGGLFSTWKRTCTIVQKCVKVLGADIVEWLENPTEGALLGELATK